MDNRKYQLVANGYLCKAIDGETICQKAEPFLMKSIMNAGTSAIILSRLLYWCKTAEVGTSAVCKGITISVKQRTSEGI